MDLFGDFSDLLEWYVDAGLLDWQAENEVLRNWNEPSACALAVGKARQFRSALRRLIKRIVGGNAPEQIILDEINRVLGARSERLYLTYNGRNYGMKSQFLFDDPIDFLYPVAKSAAELLAEGKFSLIKKCESPECILYFYDTSKNRKRRWCSMKTCGNRLKAAAHYERLRRKRPGQ